MRNAKLIQFVPEDAFVVLLEGARLDSLRVLPFVRWVGEYRAEYKIDERLLKARPYSAAGLDLMPVKILLAPETPAIEIKRIQDLSIAGRAASVTRFGVIIEARMTLGAVRPMAESVNVLWMEPAPKPVLYDEFSSKIVAGGEVTGDGTDHATFAQELGYDGRGVTVAVADSGLHNGDAASMHPDLAGRVDGFFYYGKLEDAADEHGHGTHVSGIVAGNAALGEVDEMGAVYGLGVAPMARLVAQRIFDGVGNYEAPPSFEKLTRDALHAGAQIGSNSWGDDTQGRYDLSAAEFDALVRDGDGETPGDQPYILEFSAGNAGPGSTTIGSPAVAKNVIATGASQNNRVEFIIYTEGQEAMADFSSRGPCEDGRIKPDLVAPGTWIASLQSGSATDENAWWGISANYQYQGGTSQAGPHVSGAAAVFIQYYKEWHAGAVPSPALVKAALINAAVDMEDAYGTKPVPNRDEGWGRVDLTELVSELDRAFDYFDQSVLLATGQMYERGFRVGNSSEPLKVTLAYTDVPGFPAAIPALVNDLDLELQGPDGRIYRGNQFVRGESIPDPLDSDRINNVEGIHLAAPAPGEYVVRVRARNVAGDARRDTGAVDQDFALVISGDLPLPGTGILILDRKAYRAPSDMKVTLLDPDLAGQPGVRVKVRSGTEPAGEDLVLGASGPNGKFSGTMSLVEGARVADGRVQVQHGDTLEVIYEDAQPAATRTLKARVDLRAPVISGVFATNRFGQVVISWRTDEPGTSLVRYGTSTGLGMGSTNLFLTTAHEVTLGNLEQGTTYYFTVRSDDEAGNTAIDTNGGRFYTFVPVPAATVLLVEDYSDPILDIPVTTYTDPLQEIGVSFEIWNVEERGSPTAANLVPFRVVIWRLPEFDDTPLNREEQTAIREYLKGGGALFIASMELLSRLDTGNFQSFRREVLNVESYDEDVQVPSIIGFKNDPITSGIEVQLDYSQYPDLIIIPPDISDTMTPTTNAVPVFLEPSSGKAAGLRFPKTGQDGVGRVVFLSFPFDAVPAEGDLPNTRRNILLNILRFLAPGLNGLSTIALDNHAYTVPSLMTIEVGDSGLAGQRQTSVRVGDTGGRNTRTVILRETGVTGLFRGTTTLVADGMAINQGQLPVRNGDGVFAEYFDASASSAIRVLATIDTNAPAISEVKVTPDYEEATFRWKTSEPSDALVQFGESTFLGRTAYLPHLLEEHELNVIGLVSDRQYFYQVVSRDAAGNATIDDNRGRFYTFRTLKPLGVPWFDDLEREDSNWLVFNDEIADDELGLVGSSWRRGRPTNGWETSAHSPVNAWGTNLKGAATDYANTDLISPAIELSGGNRASLRFWQSYDFTERSPDFDYELGQVYVSTNNGRNWTLLAQFDDFTFGWEEAEINLTPYLGKLIRLGWHYELLSFATVERPGWLIDDISVTVTQILEGVLQVTNNLSQASFTLTGPARFEGQGNSFIRTNAPAGDYTITFNPVPFHKTPPPQSRRLESGRVLLFLGDYSFTDANANGISDEWELKYFNQVSPDRNAATDSDGDGFTDLGEFLAGTDPLDASSKLQIALPFQLPNGTLRLDWKSASGRSYRILGSTDVRQWTPYSPWIRATTEVSSYTLPALTSARGYYFKLELRP